MAIQEDLRAALIGRAVALTEVAEDCLNQAVDPPTDASLWLWRVRTAQKGLATAEALEVAILNRCGVSWDALGAQLEVSRQALHRRLGGRADKAIEEARAFEDSNAWSLENPKPSNEYWADRIEEMRQSPMNFFGDIAAWMAPLRRQPLWWRDVDF